MYFVAILHHKKKKKPEIKEQGKSVCVLYVPSAWCEPLLIQNSPSFDVTFCITYFGIDCELVTEVNFLLLLEWKGHDSVSYLSAKLKCPQYFQFAEKICPSKIDKYMRQNVRCPKMQPPFSKWDD